MMAMAMVMGGKRGAAAAFTVTTAPPAGPRARAEPAPPSSPAAILVAEVEQQILGGPCPAWGPLWRNLVLVLFFV